MKKIQKVKNYIYKWQERLAIGISIIYIIALMLCIHLVSSCTTYKSTTRMVPEMVTADPWNYQMNKHLEPSLTQTKILETMDDIEDMREYVESDITEGIIHENYGELYLDNLDELMDKMWDIVYISYIEHESTP
jgi:hypothetical protein